MALCIFGPSSIQSIHMAFGQRFDPPQVIVIRFGTALRLVVQYEMFAAASQPCMVAQAVESERRSMYITGAPGNNAANMV